MPVPDGRDYDVAEPAFHSIAEFQACRQLIARDGRIVPCAVERIGGYHTDGGMTELADILFGPGDENGFVFELAAGDYDVLRIVDCPISPITAKTVYFTMIASRDMEPAAWKRYPGLYASDAYNMAVTSPETRRRITRAIEADTSLWNSMCEMVKFHCELGYQAFEKLGFRLSAPDEEGGEAVFIPTMKVASFFLGYSSAQHLVAIQGRWH